MAELSMKLSGSLIDIGKGLKFGMTDDACAVFIQGSADEANVGGVKKIVIVAMKDPGHPEQDLFVLATKDEVENGQVPKWAKIENQELLEDALDEKDIKMKRHGNYGIDIGEVRFVTSKKANMILDRINNEAEKKGKKFDLKIRKSKKKPNLMILGVDDDDVTPSTKIKNVPYINKLLAGAKES